MISDIYLEELKRIMETSVREDEDLTEIRTEYL
jgi:hypothetical protein